MDRLRYSHLSEGDLREVFLDIICDSAVLRKVITRAQELDLPNWRIVSGALYNTVWNHLTGRPDMYGVKDIDLMYFDPDTSWEAEDKVIRAATGFPLIPPIEVRNQARVHIWYEAHFGQDIPPLASVEAAIEAFACKTHAVGLRVVNGQYDLFAPYGLADISAMRVVPNPVRDNRETHERKAARAAACWPEVEIVSWQTHSVK